MASDISVSSIDPDDDNDDEEEGSEDSACADGPASDRRPKSGALGDRLIEAAVDALLTELRCLGAPGSCDKVLNRFLMLGRLPPLIADEEATANSAPR